MADDVTPIEVGSLWWLETDGFHLPIKARVVEIMSATGRPDRYRIFDEGGGVRHSHKFYPRSAFNVPWTIGSEPPKLRILEINYARQPRRHACADMDDESVGDPPPC